MTDQVFGELRYDDGWWGKQTLEFGGKLHTVDVLIHSDEEKAVSPKQKKTYECFLKKWPALQTDLIEALIKYYNEEERFSYGPDDEAEAAGWWPEIDTKEALLQAVMLETIVVAWDFMLEDSRCLYLLFSRTWGGDDPDDNGIGVCCINEEIKEIAYKDMAF
jgi:hypothetical protein